MAPDMRNKSAMTVGQVGAGSTAVEPKAAFAFAAGGLASHPKSELEFLETAQAGGKPFSFHFRANSEAELAEQRAAGRQRKQGEEALGASAAPEEESLDVAPSVADTDLAAPLDSTALETARRIIAELQAPPRTPRDGAKATTDGHVAVGNRFAALQAPLGDLENPPEVSQASAFQKVASLLRAAMPRATIEHAEPAARGRSAASTKNRVQPPIFVSTLIENTSLTSHENQLAVPIFRRTHLHHGLPGLLESNGIAPSRIVEQGLGRTLFGRLASDPSPDLVASTSPSPAMPPSQPNPVENLRGIAPTEAVVPVNAGASTVRRTHVPNPGAAQPLLPIRMVAARPGKITLHYGDPNHSSPNQRSAKEVESVDQRTVAANPTPRLLHEVSHEEKVITAALKDTYPLSLALSFSNPSDAVSDTEALTKQSPERKAEQANMPSTRPRPDSRHARFGVPMGPQGNAPVIAASLPVSAAHFSLRPSETSGDEGIGAGSPRRRFSTSNPQTAAVHSPAGPKLKAADAARQTQPIDAGSSQHLRTVNANTAENSLTENDLRSGRITHRGGETVSPRSFSMPGVSAFTRTDANLVSSSLRAPSSGGASRAEPVPPTQQVAPEVARPHEGHTPSPMVAKAPSASEFTRPDGNLVLSSHSAAALASVLRRERSHRNGPSGTEFTRTQKSLDSTEQSESQPTLPEAPFSKRGASASREGEQGSSVRNGHSDSEKPKLSNRIAVPAVRRPANDTADPALQTLPRQAEPSTRAPSVFSRPVDPSTQALASYSERVRAVERVVELASLQKNADLNQMNVVLRDSHLGRLSLRLVERNGLIDTLLRTDNSRTGQLIGESLPQMLEALSQKGFNVSHSGSEQWAGSQQEQRQGGRQRPPRAASRQGQRGPRAGRVFRLEIDS